MTTNKSEEAVVYAALILSDEFIAITPEKLQALLQAAGIEDVELIWATLLANALKDKNVKDILTAVTAVPAGCSSSTDSKGDGKDKEIARESKDEHDYCDRNDSDDGSTFGDLFG
jgi:large subunit ribosomal protein LP1